MKNDITDLISEYKAEYSRTTGKPEPTVTYHRGWFTFPSGDKGRRIDFVMALTKLKLRPTVQDRMETVNGEQVLVQAHKHVVKNLMTGKEVIEDRDTPLCCSVASEVYWSM